MPSIDARIAARLKLQHIAPDPSRFAISGQRDQSQNRFGFEPHTGPVLVVERPVGASWLCRTARLPR